MHIRKHLNFKFTFSNFPKRNIYFNPKVGYYAPENPEREVYVEDIKTWLRNSHPTWLMIYFTNEWNPICKQADSSYDRFVSKCNKVTHLKVNTDKFPKLRWFFDAKFEPVGHLYHSGSLLKKIGGCNFEKFDREISRAYEYVHDKYEGLPRRQGSYEMPYWAWESELEYKGQTDIVDACQSLMRPGLRGLMTLYNEPLDDRHVVHDRLRK